MKGVSGVVPARSLHHLGSAVETASMLRCRSGRSHRCVRPRNRAWGESIP
jgi:hypothetical protein